MVMVVAHRGASATHTENTVEAFEAARSQGADGIELDVRRSGDGVLVVHHDAHLTDGRLLSETESADLPDWVPTLAEVLHMSSDLWLNVEIKNQPQDPDYDATDTISVAVAGLLTAHLVNEAISTADVEPADTAGTAEPDQVVDLAALFRGRLLVSSFNVDSVCRIRSVEPAIPVGLLVWGQVDPASTIARVESHGFDAVNPHDLMVDRAFVDRARGAGLDIHVWTVDNADRIVELAEMGVDSIITNYPDRARAALRTVGTG